MISKAELPDSSEIANLHLQTINDGFLAKLGHGFLKSLYVFLIRAELVLVYKEEKNICGFVSCSFSSKGIMKHFLYSSPAGILRVAVAFLKNPKLLKPLFETFQAPAKSHSNNNPTTKINIPKTELLSISVSPLAQQGGIGTQLVNALEKELLKNDIHHYKVVAGLKLEGANRFYLKNGFILAKQITIHGHELSNVYVKEISTQAITHNSK